MSRLWDPGEPIRVDFDVDSWPISFLLWGEHHPVQKVTNRWRANAEWWKFWRWREHFKLYTSTGMLVIIYRDMLTKQWYFQRLYD